MDLIAVGVIVVLKLGSFLLVPWTVGTIVEDILNEKQAVSSRVLIGPCCLFVLLWCRQVPLDFFFFLPLFLRYLYSLTRISGAGNSLADSP